jgi:hypothetical protein
MGVNLAHFDEFLNLINDGTQTHLLEASSESTPSGDSEYWRAVQHSLMQSQWAKLYRSRAIAVIAMLDPAYADSPTAAERLVGATLRPAVAVAHRHRPRPASLNQISSNSGNSRAGGHRRKSRTRAKRRA